MGTEAGHTRPHTVCLLSSQGVGTHVMKNLRTATATLKRRALHRLPGPTQPGAGGHAGAGCMHAGVEGGGNVRTGSRWCWARRWPWTR